MATAKYTLKEVKREDKRLVREFLELPKRIYKNTPEWVCHPANGLAILK